MVRASVLVVCILSLVAGGLTLAQGGAVRVHVARANVRAAPNETGAVLTQVVAETELKLVSAEGDWYQVELPPDLRLGNARVRGWLSKKVATEVPAAPAASVATPNAPAAPAPAEPVPDPPVDKLGITVTLLASEGEVALEMETAVVRVVDVAADSLRGLVSVFPAVDSPLTAQGSAPATFVWTLPGRTSARVTNVKRPSLVIKFADFDGALPAEVAPTLVRLAPTLSGVRLVASVRAPADQATRTQAEWNFARDLRQDVIRTAVEMVGPGVARLVPSSNLDVGEYAVVIRLRRPVSGASALSADGDGRILSAVWSFAVR